MPDQDKIQEDGGKLASKYGWDGLTILQVSEAALTAANFHHEAEIIDQMIKALKNGDQPAFTLVIVNPVDETEDGEDEDLYFDGQNYTY